jgi:hypothetical protein
VNERTALEEFTLGGCHIYHGVLRDLCEFVAEIRNTDLRHNFHYGSSGECNSTITIDMPHTKFGCLNLLYFFNPIFGEDIRYVFLKLSVKHEDDYFSKYDCNKNNKQDYLGDPSNEQEYQDDKENSETMYIHVICESIGTLTIVPQSNLSNTLKQ